MLFSAGYCLKGLSDSHSHFPFMPRKDILSDLKEQEEKEEEGHASEISFSANPKHTLILLNTPKQWRLGLGDMIKTS